jgi:NCS1 family nucleobase:cation symporter-1
MIPFFSAGLHAGRVAVALGGLDMALPVGLLVAAVVYIPACRSMDLDADRRRAEAADAGLE